MDTVENSLFPICSIETFNATFILYSSSIVYAVVHFRVWSDAEGYRKESTNISEVTQFPHPHDPGYMHRFNSAISPLMTKLESRIYRSTSELAAQTGRFYGKLNVPATKSTCRLLGAQTCYVHVDRQ